jgi:hypothetical protein
LFYRCPRHLGTNTHFALLFPDAFGLVDHSAGVQSWPARSRAPWRALGDEDVGWLNVAVDDASGLRGIQRPK